MNENAVPHVADRCLQHSTDVVLAMASLCCGKICIDLGCSLQIGKTRVFLRAGQLAQLEGARGRRLTASALIIQAAFR